MFSAFVSRWFGLKDAGVSPASEPSALSAQHYEEADEADDESEDPDGSDEGFEADSRASDDKREHDGSFRPSSLFAAVYEEEADHLKEANELQMIDLDEAEE